MSSRKFLALAVYCFAGLLVLSATAQSLVWSNTLAEARESAFAQGKLILLASGRPNCDWCDYMEQTVCETPSVRSVIDEVYVPWLNNMDLSDEYKPYEVGMPQTYSLPLICMIDAYTTNAWLKRTYSLSTAGNFEAMLREAAGLAAPRPTNLFNQQVIKTNEYQVMGHIWPSAQTTNVYYRVNVGSSTANPFRSASGTTDWAASLAPFIVSGVSNQYTIEIFSRSFVKYPSKPTMEVTSATNKLVFVYGPKAVAPPAQPLISSIKVGAGVQLSLTNLTPGATSRVERSLDISKTNGWTTVTNFVSVGTTRDVFDQINPAWGGVFYRVKVSP